MGCGSSGSRQELLPSLVVADLVGLADHALRNLFACCAEALEVQAYFLAAWAQGCKLLAAAMAAQTKLVMKVWHPSACLRLRTLYAHLEFIAHSGALTAARYQSCATSMHCWCHAAVVVDRPFSWWLQAHALPGEWGEPEVMMDMATAALFLRRAAAVPVPPVPLPDSVGLAFLRSDASALCSSDRAVLPWHGRWP